MAKRDRGIELSLRLSVQAMWQLVELAVRSGLLVPVVRETKQDAPALSEREREVAQLIVDGQNDHAIASALSLSYATVRAHRRSVYKKLGVHSVAELKARWYDVG